jgi:siroheme synthase-like protein
MAYFPFFVNLQGKTALVIGGGKVARRKVEKLLPYGVLVRLIAPQVCSELETMPEVTIVRRRFQPSDLCPKPALVVAATDDEALNRSISQQCQGLDIPVNVVDKPQDSSFLFPALVQQGSLTVGISTAGASPTAAIWVKEQVKNLLPEAFDQWLVWMGQQRIGLQQTMPEEADRVRALKRLFQAVVTQGRTLTDEEVTQILEGGSL